MTSDPQAFNDLSVFMPNAVLLYQQNDHRPSAYSDPYVMIKSWPHRYCCNKMTTDPTTDPHTRIVEMLSHLKMKGSSHLPVWWGNGYCLLVTLQTLSRVTDKLWACAAIWTPIYKQHSVGARSKWMKKATNS